jgi:tripartite-type tricarboxylate transporter receptor subunit TctC
MRISIAAAITVVALLAVATDQVRAGDAQFYEGKEVRLIVGADVGGPYDAYGRLLARHLGRYIPGNPRIIVQNMPGATGVLAANYVYHRAPQDGTVIGALTNIIPLSQLLGQVDTHFDLGRLNWLGSAAQELYTVYVRSDSPVHSLNDATHTKVTMGATTPTAMSSLFPTVLNNIAGTQFQVVTGYIGMAQVQIAMQRGEVEGIAGDSWMNGKGTGPAFNWYEEGIVRPIVLIGSHKPPELLGVPLLVELSQDPEMRKVLELFSLPPKIGKPFVTGPEVPAERVVLLRKAFDMTVRSPEFMGDAAKLGLPVDPLSGEELSSLVTTVANAPQSVWLRARAALRR